MYFKEKSPICDNFVRERSVDSDDGNTTAESVVGTLGKLNGLNSTINKQKQKQQINRFLNFDIGISDEYSNNIQRRLFSTFIKIFSEYLCSLGTSAQVSQFQVV